MAKEVMAGCRTPGGLLARGNGACNGIDLPNDHCRLILFANQIMEGTRLPGFLTDVPPAVLPDVPPLAAAGWSGTQRAGGGALPPPAYRERPAAERATQPRATSNDIVSPFSIYMLGTYSPYRDIRLPETCFECNAARSHFGSECPQRYARVLGDVPPGWMLAGRAAVRNPADWEGSELTAAARAAYRSFLGTHALHQHRQFPVTIEDITGPSPPPLRRPVGGRHQ